MAMKDMARDPGSLSEDFYPSTEAVINRYPFGLCISMCKEELDKLSLPMPEVGDMVEIRGLARVTATRESQREGQDEPDLRVELQITHLEAEGEDDEEAGPTDD